ncbi:hypothetical protein SY83_16875 [Paenibacillus swuensis]|uniref:DUF4367 domain-containing protein n=1 Tax=Paenibacillus swuensis TaxID=1178515 RepID=A0A172TKW4_9BACL|nr:hypothetical protein [Paenibacillus swuensis]ANE47678.1 hypothetical protein SY83_16875 [Paenibacillus swuensis]
MKTTDQAWKEMQEKLKDAKRHEQWQQWDSGVHVKQATSDGERAALTNSSSSQVQSEVALKTNPVIGRKRVKYPKWVSGVVAASVVAVVLATPVGNSALASILGQFRMEQITTVDEQDAKVLFESFFPDGESREAVNAFGTFSRESGKRQGEFDAKSISDVLGRTIVVPSDFKQEKVYVNASDRLTFKVNVDEVNKSMRKLGATELFPSSLDQKTITIEMGESVHMNLSNEDGKSWSNLTQQPVPKVIVDSSVELQEALDAIVSLPMLPTNLKTTLLSSNFLNDGSAPLPLITDAQTSKIQVGSTNVLLQERKHSSDLQYDAIWIHNGQLFSLSGNVFKNQQEIEAKISELIN